MTLVKYTPRHERVNKKTAVILGNRTGTREARITKCDPADPKTKKECDLLWYGWMYFLTSISPPCSGELVSCYLNPSARMWAGTLAHFPQRFLIPCSPSCSLSFSPAADCEKSIPFSSNFVEQLNYWLANEMCIVKIINIEWQEVRPLSWNNLVWQAYTIYCYCFKKNARTSMNECCYCLISGACLALEIMEIMDYRDSRCHVSLVMSEMLPGQTNQTMQPGLLESPSFFSKLDLSLWC